MSRCASNKVERIKGRHSRRSVLQPRHPLHQGLDPVLLPPLRRSQSSIPHRRLHCPPHRRRLLAAGGLRLPVAVPADAKVMEPIHGRDLRRRLLALPCLGCRQLGDRRHASSDAPLAAVATSRVTIAEDCRWAGADDRRVVSVPRRCRTRHQQQRKSDCCSVSGVSIVRLLEILRGSNSSDVTWVYCTNIIWW
jgi:hypothetical protein